MNRMKAIWYILLVFLFLFFGCFGLQTTGECAGLTNPEKKMECYHQAAMLSAYKGYEPGARSACNEIYNFAHLSYEGTSIERKAEVQRNNCYFDIAKILATKGDSNARALCNEITEKPGSGLLFGSAVTSEVCGEQVERLEKLNPEEYYSNENNICSSVVFIIPLTAFLFVRLVHNL